MLEFHYNVMKKQTDCVLLYSDTDSFIYKLKSKNFYDDLKKTLDLKNHFDLSNFPTDHKLYDRSNKRVVLKFKDELAGTPIQEFCALKPKLYSILVANGQTKMTAKGTKKFAQAKLNHEMFKKTLETGDLVRVENIKFNTDKHQLQTVYVNKIALSAYDDKRYISSNRKTTLPFGHYSLRDEYITKKMCVETDWDTEYHEPYNVFELPEVGEALGWETPDPGFYRPSYSNEDLNDVVDLPNLSDHSDDSNQEISNPFILNEADESLDNSTSSSDSDTTLANISKQRKKTANVNRNLFNESMILETLTLFELVFLFCILNYDISEGKFQSFKRIKYC